MEHGRNNARSRPFRVKLRAKRQTGGLAAKLFVVPCIVASGFLAPLASAEVGLTNNDMDALIRRCLADKIIKPSQDYCECMVNYIDDEFTPLEYQDWSEAVAQKRPAEPRVTGQTRSYCTTLHGDNHAGSLMRESAHEDCHSSFLGAGFSGDRRCGGLALCPRLL
jgi:hypothetical protein